MMTRMNQGTANIMRATSGFPRLTLSRCTGRGGNTYTATRMKRRLALACLIATLCSTGCVRRSLTVTSNPPGALVYLNGTEVGRTPLTRDFTWYGTYDVTLRKEGYETLKTEGKVIAPWWQWVPFDLFAELLPLHDRQALSYAMHPYAQATVDPQQMLRRAEGMEGQLESSRFTRAATTRPTSTR